MGSKTRQYIQDEPMYRGVNVNEDGSVWHFTGPYNTAAKAKRSVFTPGGWIEVAKPMWYAVDEWTR